MRAGPHIGEDQRPEMDDGQAVAVDRASSLFGDEVIHHSQKTGGQKKAYGVVSVPPLHHGVLHTGIGRVRLHPTRRDGRAVDQMQQGDCEDESPEKPVGHVNMAHLARTQGTEKHHCKADPYEGDQDVNRPLELRVFLALGIAQRERNGCGQNDRLPAPESECSQFVAEEPHLAGTLGDVVGRGEQAAAAKRKNHRVGVQGPQPPVTEPWNAHADLGPGQFGGDDQADQHADHPPHHRHERKLAHHRVVVDRRILVGKIHTQTSKNWLFAVSIGWHEALLT